VVTIFLLVLLWWQLVARGSLEFSEPLVVEEGDTLSSILDKQSALTRWRTLRAAAGYDYDPHQLEVGVYGAIEGEMSVADFYTALADGPGAVLERITVLE
jgi:cell division protein YceG involved in septum cleavage